MSSKGLQAASARSKPIAVKKLGRVSYFGQKSWKKMLIVVVAGWPLSESFGSQTGS